MHEHKKMGRVAKTALGISSLLLITVLSTLVMTACANTQNNTEAPTQSPTESGVTANHPENTPSSAALESGSNASSRQTSGSSASGSGVITPEAAKKTALFYAGVSSANIKGYRSELDHDDGRQVYEIEFFADGFEYDCEVDAKTGEIVKFNKERD